MGINSNSKM